ncbi:aspartate/glutamate racemase family protein [Streptomyces sp. NPDC051657]|uniref:aspartate/glutamate racemase family protein n=1 Tax=unclassified Streptomyces TaxID=2593676 RepID=UPI0034243D5E
MSGGAAGRARAPRIALISATPTAVAPAVAGLAEEFPAAEPWNLLDDRLLGDAPEDGPLPQALVDRMTRLIGHALAGGADGVLLTCSLYGSVTETVQTPVPLLAPDSAAFEQALALSEGRGRVLVLASFEAAMRDSLTRFSAAAAAAGPATEPVGVVAPDAFAAARDGDLSTLHDALRDACLPLVTDADTVLLAQFSLAPAAASLSTALGVPVVSGPHAAAAALRTALTGSPL